MVDALTELALAARQDRRSLEEFARLIAPDVSTWCRFAAGNGADDLAQDVMIRILSALERYRGDAPARLWALSITRRAAVDHYRSTSRRRRLSEQLHTLRVVGQDSDVECDPAEGLALGGLLAVLDDDRREAFVLTQLHRLSYDEAAEVMDCPVGTIRSRVARARELLAVALRDAESAAR